MTRGGAGDTLSAMRCLLVDHPLRLAGPALLIALALGGCLLAEEDCGDGFALDGSRCVPATAPPAPSADAAMSPPPDDADVLPDAGPIAGNRPESWAPYVIIALLDRTPPEALARTPDTPGADLDAINVLTRSGDETRVIGNGARVIDSPGIDAERVTGPPDGDAASLGTAGGRVFVQLTLERPLAGGDAVVVHELDEPEGEADSYVIFVCQAPLDPMRGCRQIGVGGAGLGVFVLP